jgi:hypothetical protein
MAVLDRLRGVLIAAVVALIVVLAGAVVLGVVLRSAQPLPFPTSQGRTIDQARNDHSEAGRRLHLTGNRVGILVSCRGSGDVVVSIGTPATTGGVGTHCTPTADGAGYVLADLPAAHYSWRVQSRAGTRWAVTFSDPLDEGGGDLVP